MGRYSCAEGSGKGGLYTAVCFLGVSDIVEKELHVATGSCPYSRAQTIDPVSSAVFQFMSPNIYGTVEGKLL